MYGLAAASSEEVDLYSTDPLQSASSSGQSLSLPVVERKVRQIIILYSEQDIHNRVKEASLEITNDYK